MSERRTLKEKLDQAGNTGKRWIEPMKTWVKTAQNVGCVAKEGSPKAKKALALEVFGSNLVLDDKKPVVPR